MQREGVFREMKRRRFYEKPSENATREQGEAIQLARKHSRQKAQREGLIAAPKGKAPKGKGGDSLFARDWRTVARRRWPGGATS